MSVATCSDKILDAKEQVIEKGSIVEIAMASDFSRNQGLVIDPNSDVVGHGHTVAVFFNKEVSRHRFLYLGEKAIMDPEIWDEKFLGQCPEILFTSDMWKVCPRIVFFRPRELIVHKEWDIKTLAERLFSGSYHVLRGCRIPFEPGTHACFVEGCDGIAMHRTLFNIWGSVSTIYTCDACHKKINGMCADSGPEIKNPVPHPPGWKD